MKALTLEKKIAQLPEKLRLKAEKMIDAMLDEARRQEINNVFGAANNRGYGSLKGKVWMSDDFNEPLEDFKDYM